MDDLRFISISLLNTVSQDPRSSLNHSKNPRCILGLKIYPDRDVRDRRIDRYLTLVLETRDFERHLPIIALS